MITISIGSKKFTAPSSWNELTKVQLFAFIALVYAKLDTIFTEHTDKDGAVSLGVKSWAEYNKARTALLFFLLGYKWYHFRTFFKLGPVVIDTLLKEHKVTDFLFRKRDLTQNIIRSFRLGLTRYYGPVNEVDELSGDEFSFAHTYFVRWKETQSEQYLNTFIACLYRPKRLLNYPAFRWYKQDIRQDFQLDRVDHYTDKFARLPLRYKLGVALWFESVMATMPKKYPYVFTRENKKRAENGGWLPVLIHMTKGKIADLMPVRKTNVAVLFTALNIEGKEAERVKEEYEKEKKKRKN